MSDSRAIQDLLDRVKRRYRRLSIVAAVAGMTAAVLVALALQIAVDQIVPLPRWFRVLTLLGGFSAAGLAAWKLLSGPLAGRVNDLYLARCIEARYGHLKSGLTTYVELTGADEETLALRELVGERVAADLEPIREHVVVPSREARRRSVWLGGAVAGCLVLLAISPSGFWRSFQRSLIPTRNLTETRIVEVLPGNATAYKGKDVEIAVRLEGKLPPAARLRIASASIDLPIRPDGWYRCVLPGVTEGFTYSIEAHDASSDDYRLRVADVPRLKSMAARLRFPGYTGFPERKQDTGNLDAIEGTDVTLEGVATRPLKSAAVAIKGRRVPATDVRGDKFSVRFPLGESFEYSVELTDRDDVPDPEPSKFRAVVRKDTPPQVTVTVPGKNVELSEAGTVNLACRVMDDFGITALRLTAKINGKIPKVVPLTFPDERQFVSETALDLKALQVVPGDYVEYFLTAVDNREPSPQSGQSPSFIITVQSSLPLLTFADVNPGVKVEKYRDPLDRKGSVEARSEKLLSEERTKEAGKTQEPPKREVARREVHKTEEKKPEGKKDDPAGAGPQKAEPEGGREDSLAKLLEEKKDLVERLLSKAGAKDGAGDGRGEAKDAAESRDGDGKEEAGEGRKSDDKSGQKGDSPAGAADKSGELARQGAGKAGREGAASQGRTGKNGSRGEGAEPGDGTPGAGEDAQPGEPGYEEGKKNGQGAAAKAGSRGGKKGSSGRGGRGGEGDGGDDGEGGDGDGDDGDDEDDYDLSHLFPFEDFGGT